MLGTKLLCPGASNIVKCFFSVSKNPLPTSTVFPFSRSSELVSIHHDRYHVSLFFSFASRSYFSRVRLSTMPVKYMIWPPIVDFPASTWPMNTTLTCSFSVVVASLTSGLTFVLGFEAGTKVSLSMEFSSSSGVVAVLLRIRLPPIFPNYQHPPNFQPFFRYL